MLEPLRISAVNRGGNTIHFGLGLKPVTKLLGLNEKSKAVTKNRLSEVTLLTIDKFSMVSSNLWIAIDSRLGEIFMRILGIVFVGLSVMTLANLLQLPSVREKLTFSQFSDKETMKQLLGLQL